MITELLNPTKQATAPPIKWRCYALAKLAACKNCIAHVSEEVFEGQYPRVEALATGYKLVYPKLYTKDIAETLASEANALNLRICTRAFLITYRFEPA